MKSLTLYRYCNYLSLDVACGAMTCASFFAHILHVQLLPYGLASLGLTVWIIYTADHLLDVRKLTHTASSQRHRFHQSNFRRLFVILILALLVDLLLIFFVRKPILGWGMALSVVVLLYLWAQQKLVLFKELVISLLYSAGILLPALSLTKMTLAPGEIVLIVYFTLTALHNLILFSWYDWQQDMLDNHASLVTSLGKTQARKIYVALVSIQILLFFFLVVGSPYAIESIVLLLMNGVLLVLFLFPSTFLKKDLYRIIGDAVFLVPLLYLLLMTNYRNEI